MNIEPEIILINNIEYITVRDMARIINKSDQTVYKLLTRGNAIRKMKSIKIAEKVFIPYSELTEYPFTYCGSGNLIYHYDNNGKIVDENIAVPYNIEYKSKDYPEDKDLENGNYICNCIECGEKFVGHKGRILCKECSNGRKN